MRKCRLFLCVVLVLSLMGCTEQTKQVTDPIYTNGVYEVSISASLRHNNSVRNDWRNVYTCEGSTISSGKRWTVPLDTVKTVAIEATITENKGRYKGNTAEREITCTVALVDKVG